MVHSTKLRGSTPTLAAMGMIAFLTSCVDTHLEDTDLALPCSAQVAPTSAAEALIWVRAELGDEGNRFCSAVAVAPRLAITTYSCVAHPGDLDPERMSSSEGPRFPVDRQTYFDPAEYEAFCSRTDSWTDIEDGSFRSRLSAPVAQTDVGVGRTGEDRPTLGVDQVIAAGSSSRCNEGLAVLLLSESLLVGRVPLRLDDFAEVGESVMTSGIAALEGRFVRRDQSGTIERVTRERGDEALPPQSLLLGAGSCYLSRGGPVFAEASGALVGLVVWGQSASCDNGVVNQTVALRLSSFRTLLLQTASTYGQTLFSELRTGTDVEATECDAPTKSAPSPGR